jgi:CubicO group peptidase (beta-lactamase class C family)
MNIKFLFFASIVVILSSCKVIRNVEHGALPQQKDQKIFTTRLIEKEGPTFYFKNNPSKENLGKKIGVTNRDFNATNISLDSFVRLYKTISFVIIRNDTLLFQYYKKSDTTIVSSFSMAKPLVSTLIGIAIDEGKIKSIDDKIVNYIPELEGKTGWDKITIKNLLQHTSGIKFTDRKYDIFSDNADFYWGNNLRKEVLKSKLECAPNVKFKYSSENTMLLALILENVTGNTLSFNLQEKIWKPLGMESNASWSLDRKDEKAIEKAFCCIQGKTLDFAKFARLYLNEGNWNGNQIVSKKWVDYSVHQDTSGNNRRFFNNNWGLGPLKYGSYYAVGLYGQYLYVYPEKKIIIIRFGESTLSYHPSFWQNIFLQIIDQM